MKRAGENDDSDSDWDSMSEQHTLPTQGQKGKQTPRDNLNLPNDRFQFNSLYKS